MHDKKHRPTFKDSAFILETKDFSPAFLLFLIFILIDIAFIIYYN